MEKNTVERYDHIWYSLMMWLAVVVGLITAVYTVFSLCLWYAGSPAKVEWPGSIHIMLYLLIGLVGFLLLITVMLLSVSAKIRADRKLNRSLNNEMARDSENRSTRIGFYVFALMLGVSSLLTNFIADIPVSFVMRFILLCGVLSMLIAWLYYNRELKH